MRFELEVSWRRLRRGVFIAVPVLLLSTALLGPAKLMLFDSGLAIPASIFVLWLATQLFAEDDREVTEAYLRLLPIDPRRVFWARAALGLGVTAAVMAVLVPLVYFGPLGWMREALFDDEVYFLPPGDPALLAAWLFAIFGGSAWFAKATSRPATAQGAGWIAWLGTTLVALHPLLLGGPLHRYMALLLTAAGAFGLLGAAGAVRRREVLAAELGSQVLGPPRKYEALVTVPAQLLFVVAPLGLLALMIGRSTVFVWRGPEQVVALGLVLFAGVASLPLAHARARKRGFGPLRTGALFVVALSGLGWALWSVLRRPHPTDDRLGPVRIPHRLEAGVVLLLAPVLGFHLVVSFVRPMQVWRIEIAGEDMPHDHAEILRDGESIGFGTAEGWSLSPVAGDFMLGSVNGSLAVTDLDGRTAVSARELIAALHRDRNGEDLPPHRELERSLPQGRYEVRLDGLVLPLQLASAQTTLTPATRRTVLELRVDSTVLLEEVRAFNDLAYREVPPRAALARWADLGDAFWCEARRRLVPRWRTRPGRPQDSKYELGEEEHLSWRTNKLAALEAVLRARFEGEGFATLWRGLEQRRARLEPLLRDHYGGGVRQHLLALEPWLRALAHLEGEDRARLDERLEAGDAHAAIVAGLRGDARDGATLERLLGARMAQRGTLAGGIARLDIDQVALAYGWALLAVDRTRGTRVLRERLADADPLGAELLVINDDDTALAEVLERWIGATDTEIARTWRLRDAREVADLRQRLRRALWGVGRDVDPIDYLEQSPGWGAFVPTQKTP